MSLMDSISRLLYAQEEPLNYDTGDRFSVVNYWNLVILVSELYLKWHEADGHLRETEHEREGTFIFLCDKQGER